MNIKRVFIILFFVCSNSLASIGNAGYNPVVPQPPTVGSQSNELLAIADLPGRIIGGLLKNETPLYPEFKQKGRDGGMNDMGQASKYGLLSASQKIKANNTINEYKSPEIESSNLLNISNNAQKAQAPPGTMFFACIFLLIYLVSLRKGNIPGDSAILIPIRRT